jgi:hypothetical protein
MRKIFHILSIICLFTLLFESILSCESITYWHADLHGNKTLTVEADGYMESIQTNDLKRLQQVTPFKIVVPKYWPSELVKYLPHLVETINVIDPKSIDVTIHNWNYQDLNNPKDINIVENNSLYGFGHATAERYYFYVSGIQVTGSLISQSFGKYPNNTVIIGHYFSWTKGNVNIAIEVYGYDLTESKKVVESMFE